MLEIGNRRYVGSKRSLVSDIFDIVEFHIKKDTYSVVDLFAGTGIVSSFFAQNGKNVIVNDILYSNFIAYQTWLGGGVYDERKLKGIISDFNQINPNDLSENYFSRIYGGKYFSTRDAKKIGYIRDAINDMDLTKREYFILVTSLMYAADKIANTVGHFEHFLSKKPVFKDVTLLFPKNIDDYSTNVTIYSEDANDLVRKVQGDVVYVDPPYNARQYVNFYHVLENLARWEKPDEFEGISMKFKRDHLKSDYSRAKAPFVMEDLIQSTVAKLIVVSYNNTYNAKSGASNNKITEEQMEGILSRKGDVVEKRSIDYKFFNSGKTDFKEHKEFLYVCKVRN